MRRDTRIAVVGAGLGGLTVAGLLARAGFEVSVHEQSAGFARIGAGIILSANGLKVLRRLGLEEALLAQGFRPQAFISRDWTSGMVSYDQRFDAAAYETEPQP